MAQSVESPEGSEASRNSVRAAVDVPSHVPLHAPVPAAVPAPDQSPSQEPSPGSFVSPKKQKTDTGHAVRLEWHRM